MTYPVLSLHLNGTGVVAKRDLGGDIHLVFQAEAVREERTGIHARLEISLGNVSLAWTVCNVEKDEARLRLANRATRQLSKEQRGDYQPDYLQHDLDYFCRHLWEVFLGQFSPQKTIGLENWEPDFLLKPYIIRGGGTILFAPPKTLKSYMALLMAQSVNTGSSKLWPVQYENTLFVNLERSHISVQGRLARVNAALGLAVDMPLHILAGRGRSLKSLVPVLERYIAANGITVGVLDSISRTGMGGLIAPEEVNPVIDMLSHLFPSWLALAHTPRVSEEHPWGGQMWDAGADILLRLKSQVSERYPLLMGVVLAVSAANDMPIPAPQIWEIDFSQGFSISRATLADYPELASAFKMSLTQQILSYLIEKGKATASQLSRELDRNRGQINTILKNDRRFIQVATGTKGQIFYGVRQTPIPESPNSGAK